MTTNTEDMQQMERWMNIILLLRGGLLEMNYMLQRLAILALLAMPMLL